VTLARILCDNFSGIGNMDATTLHAFSRPEAYNRSTIHHCKSLLIPEIDLWSWFDTFK